MIDNYIDSKDNFHNIKLLYVEDDRIVRETAYDILHDIFDTVIVAVDGKDGLSKFIMHDDIDLIVTDLNMPKLDGFEMIEKIRHQNPHIPIVIVSAHNQINFLEKSIQLGVDGYLIKPIDLDQLLSVLLKVVNKINLEKENKEYKLLLEQKVKEQLEDIRNKDMLLMRQAKMVEMGEMVDVIAHQWKQPLHIIKMYNQMLELDININILDTTKIKHCINKTYSQINHLEETINEFRNFLVPNENIKNIKLINILNSISILLKDQLISCNTRLKLNCSDTISIVANENDIKHLFISLINNAKEEMVKQNIDLEQRIIDIDITESQTDIIITVKDNGKGINLDIIDNIFQPHITTKADEGGTGIGLYMCKKIIDKYYGTIYVQNGEQGAIFTIHFPKDTL